MFDVQPNRITKIDLPFIVNNFTILHYDEIPMLFTGTNEYGNHIVGSIMCEDEDGDILRYIHVICKAYDYAKFIKKKISYRELILTQEYAFLIDKNFEEEILNTYYVLVSEIPDRFLPHPELFCPSTELVLGTDFTISLKGKLADMHEALSERVTIISKGINQLFANIIDTVGAINSLESQITQLAPTATSFGLNYRIRFKLNSHDLFSDNNDKEAALNEFVSSSINYSINYLSSEAKELTENKIDNTQYQKLVEEPLKKVYAANYQKYDDKAKEKALNNTLKIPFEIEKITDQLGMGFDYLEVNSCGLNNEKSTIGLVDRSFSDAMMLAKDIIEADKEDVKTDEDYDLNIHIYHLNVISRKGNAHINVEYEQNKFRVDSPKIEIIGDKSLNGSEFINSMDTGDYIKVHVKKSKKVNGRYKNLTIEF